MMMAMATPGEKLRRLRRGQAMTQEELAKASGVSPSTIVAIERGERASPHPATLGKLAKALGVTPFDLLED